jgi:hypothetical protein
LIFNEVLAPADSTDLWRRFDSIVKEPSPPRPGEN